MDLKTRKLNMIEYLIQLKDEILFEKIEEFITSESNFLADRRQKSGDFWDDLTPSQQEEIIKASSEIEEGKAIDYESFMAKHR